ncbi:MAG: hypothetical protein Aureis2KO_08490 [Aureisphaera sp.]
MSKYTKEEILNALDNTGAYNFFLDLEHGYFHTAGSRINLYADENKWAIVFEKSGFGNRSVRAEIELNFFGNCLINLDRAGVDDRFICNSKYLTLISGEEFEKIEGDFELVSKEATKVKVRDKELTIDQNNESYGAMGIEIQDFDNPDGLIDYPSLVRYLDETNPEVFRATENELRMCIPVDVPFLMKIDKWHHRSYSEFGGDKPSTYETFNLIADILMSRNSEDWNPTLEPNNNWRNWPEAGGL